KAPGRNGARSRTAEIALRNRSIVEPLSAEQLASWPDPRWWRPSASSRTSVTFTDPKLAQMDALTGSGGSEFVRRREADEDRVLGGRGPLEHVEVEILRDHVGAGPVPGGQPQVGLHVLGEQPHGEGESVVIDVRGVVGVQLVGVARGEVGEEA